MLGHVFKTVFGSRNERLVKEYRKVVAEVNSYENALKMLDTDALKAKTPYFKEKLAQNCPLDDILPEAFAVVRETSRRLLNMRHFDVQLIGGLAMHNGKIAEMSTGEGKTLAATLPAYLNALTGNPVHIVTVNDYLVRRDAAWMATIYNFLGLSVGINVPGMDHTAKKAAYQSDILYGTNNEFGFDYLRDNMAFSLEEKVQRALNFAVVDEVDSILIDEARTPLIISGPAEDSSFLYKNINELIPLLSRQQQEDGAGDFSVDEKSRQVFLTEAGHDHIEKLLLEKGLLPVGQSLYEPMQANLMHHVNAALKAHAIFRKDVEYIVRDNQVIIVDEHTGRTMPGRRWSEGIHQAVEAKENVSIQQENQTLASITFQNYFRLYKKLSGMTGTADTEAYEFQQIYGLEVVVIPTNRACQRKDMPDLIYLTRDEKFDSIIKDIKDCQTRKQPVLVGTVSIETSEYLSERLKKEGIPHQVLNAKYHEQEANIIAEAGRPGAVTIATNMAGRGTDIVLGGSFEVEKNALENPTEEQIAQLKQNWQARHDEVVALGGLHIIGTERHESRRIDNQLRGRSGRQGDPGSSRFYLALEDNLMRIFAPPKLGEFMRKIGMKHGEAVTAPMVSRGIENAQRRVEGYHFDIRKQLLEFDDIANQQRKIIYQERDELLHQEDVNSEVTQLIEEVLDNLCERFIPLQALPEEWDIQALSQMLRSFSLELPLVQWLENTDLTQLEFKEKVIKAALAFYEAKRAENLEAFKAIEKTVMLHALDKNWKEHLALMDHLRQSVGLRGYAQKDPKQEYKRESFHLFESLLVRIKQDAVATLLSLSLPPEEEVRAAMAANEAKANEAPALQNIKNEHSEMLLEHKVGRNELCPCGSGEKYKNCHGRIAEMT